VDIAMIAAQAGFDCVYVDMEHSPISLETTSIICAGCHGLGITPLCGPPSHAADWISRVLDGGAQGLIVPHRFERETGAGHVSAARFPPLGQRSVMGATPALAYRSFHLRKQTGRSSAETLLIVMIERPRVSSAPTKSRGGRHRTCCSSARTISVPSSHPGRAETSQAARRVRRGGQGMQGARQGDRVGGIRGDLELQTQLYRLGARFIHRRQ